MQNLKDDYISVAWDCFMSHARQWWAWVWVGGSLLIVNLVPPFFNIIGWVSLIVFMIYFIIGVMIVRNMRMSPDDAWDPPYS